MRLLSTKIIVIEALLGLEGFDRCTDSDFFLSVWTIKLLNAVVSLDAVVASTPGHQHHRAVQPGSPQSTSGCYLAMCLSLLRMTLAHAAWDRWVHSTVPTDKNKLSIYSAFV